MKFGEVIPELRKCLWVRRSAWHPEYAVKLCNVNEDCNFTDRHTVSLTSTLDLFYNLGHTYAPCKGDDLNQNNINESEYGKKDPVWRRCGLNCDIFCDDWEIADQDLCERIVKKTKLDNKALLKKMDDERLRPYREQKKREAKDQRERWNRILEHEKPLEDNDPNCEECL